MSNNYSVENVLNSNDIEKILKIPGVEYQRRGLSRSNTVKFFASLPRKIKEKLDNSLGIKLSNVENVPMRWIKGDTATHIDRGQDVFVNTYIVYLTNSVGSLIVDGNNYPIQAGNAVFFGEGVEHSTQGTDNTERLMIGPISERLF
jgi:hypothetical protein